MYTIKEIKEGSESGINSKRRKTSSFIYIHMYRRLIDYVSISEYSYSTRTYILKEYYGVCFLWYGGIVPKDGFYSNDSLEDSVSSSTKLPAVSKWGICYCLRLQLQGQPAPQTSWDGMGNKPSTAVFFFTSFKRISFPSPPLIFIYNKSGDPWGKIQTTKEHVGDCNHSHLASKLNLEKNVQVKH